MVGIIQKLLSHISNPKERRIPDLHMWNSKNWEAKSTYSLKRRFHIQISKSGIQLQKLGGEINIHFQNAVPIQIPKRWQRRSFCRVVHRLWDDLEDLSRPNLAMYISLHTSDNTFAVERKKVFLRRVVLKLLEWVSWFHGYNPIDGLAITLMRDPEWSSWRGVLESPKCSK